MTPVCLPRHPRHPQHRAKAIVDITRYLEKRRAQVDSALNRLLPQANRLPQRLNEAIRYSLLGGGKRLRPILLLACAEAVGGDPELVMPWACALECIHTYSLIHDDLPAMDDDDLRRGRPTCHKQFDEATAILAGDALLTYAFTLAGQPLPGVDPAISLAMIVQMARDAGIHGMVGGQMLDLLAENQEVSLAELQNIHIHKTGALIRASCLIGATLGGGSAALVHQIEHYGKALGLAFQIIDDCLDEVGDAKVMGKSVGSDRKKAKATYTRLLGLPQARQEAAQLIEEAIRHLESFDQGADPLRELARFILTRSH